MERSFAWVSTLQVIELQKALNHRIVLRTRGSGVRISPAAPVSTMAYAVREPFLFSSAGKSQDLFYDPHNPFDMTSCLRAMLGRQVRRPHLICK